MFKKPSAEDLKLAQSINAVLDRMEDIGPGSEEYPKLVAQLKELNQLKQSNKTDRKVDPNTRLLVAGNLLGIVIIVAYEHAHVVTSKGLSLLTKVK